MSARRADNLGLSQGGLDMADSGLVSSPSLSTERESDGGSPGLARRLGNGGGDSEQNSSDSSSDKEPLIFSPDAASTQKLSVARKLAFAVGSMPYAMCNTVVGFYFSIFLLEVAILDPVYVLVIVFLGRVWDAITDPIVGYLCLITRTRFGRLRPWMMTAVAPAGLVYTFLWFVPPSLDNNPPVAKFFYYICLYFAFQALLTCIHVPYTSLTMHLSHDNKERDSATLYRMVFEVMGTVLGIVIYTIYFVAFVHSSEESCDSGQREPSIPERRTYRYHAVTIGVIIILMILVTFLGVREQKDEVETNRKIGLLRGIRLTFGFRPFLYLFLLNLFSWLTIQFIQGNLALYIKYSLGLGDQYPYLIAILLISTILWMPLWQFVMIKLGKKTAFAIALWQFAPALLMMLFVTYVPYLVYPLVIYGGLGVSALYLIPWSMVPDVIDEACVTNMVRREELFYSFFVFGNKFAGGVTLAISTAIYKAAGYDENKCQQPWQVALTLKLLVVIPPILFLLIALLFLHLYPVNEARREATKKMLSERRRSSAQPPPSSSSSSSSSASGGSVTVAMWSSSHGDSLSPAEVTHL